MIRLKVAGALAGLSSGLLFLKWIVTPVQTAALSSLLLWALGCLINQVVGRPVSVTRIARSAFGPMMFACAGVWLIGHALVWQFVVRDTQVVLGPFLGGLLGVLAWGLGFGAIASESRLGRRALWCGITISALVATAIGEFMGAFEFLVPYQSSALYCAVLNCCAGTMIVGPGQR